MLCSEEMQYVKIISNSYHMQILVIIMLSKLAIDVIRDGGI